MGVVVVGLGGMGGAVAERIACCGFPVAAVDTAAAARDRWRRATGREAYASVAEVAWPSVAHVVIAVRTAAQARTVLDAVRRWPPAAEAGCFVVTTLDPATAESLARGAEAGPRVIEAPVSGGEDAAREGRLSVMLAGPVRPDDRDFLTATVAGRTIGFDTYTEPTLAKLVNNVTAAFNALAAAEMLRLGSRLGLPPRRLHEVLLASSGASWMAAALPRLRTDLLDKDVRLLAEVCALPELSLAGRELPERLAAAVELLGGEPPPPA